MNITLRQLRIFLAVADQQHFRRAAERLYLTPPAVSRQISELETELGVRLFDRNTREVVLTEAGRYLHHAVERVLDELEGVLQHLHDEGLQRRGKVRIASVPTLSASLLPPCIADCARHFPELDIVLRDQVQTLVLAGVRGGEVDFGVTIDPPGSNELEAQTIMHDPFCLVCRRDHPLADRRTVHWRDLHEQALVLLDHESGSRRLIDRILAEHGVQARVAQQIGHSYTAFRMVEAGLGISIAPVLSLPLPASTTLVVRPLRPLAQRAVKLVRRRNRSLSPAASIVWDQLSAMAAAWPSAMGLDTPIDER